MEKVYKFSEETIKQRKKLMVLMALIMLVAMIIFAFILTGTMDIKDLKLFIKILSVMVVIITLEMFIVSRIMFKKLRTLEIVLTENGIERRGGKFTELIQFKDLMKIKVSKEPSGKIAFIKLKSSKKSFTVAGFENMDDLENEIKVRVEDTTQIKIKIWKYNWNSNMTSLYSAIVMTIIIALIMKFGLNIYHIFNKIFGIGFAIYFLVFRPISKNAGKRFRLFETITGVLIIVFMGISIILDLIG